MLRVPNHLLLVGAVFAWFLPATSGQKGFFPIPDPFKSPGTPGGDGYYAIKSFQTTVSSTGARNDFEVNEYFSLAEGISFSLHKRSHSKQPSDSFVLISDAPKNKFYLISDPDSKESSPDCQLDQQHRIHHTFPWQYQYELPATKTNATGSTKKSSIYGVGAVWLNAIQRKLQSRQVGDNSPYPNSNLWLMREREHNVEVKLLFDKPSASSSAKATNAAELGQLIARSKLEKLIIRREVSGGQLDEPGATSAQGAKTDEGEIVISNFEADLAPDHERLRKFQFQLNRCREQNRKRRVFPSLMKAISTSPQRLLGLDYLETKFGKLLAEQLANGRKSGEYDARLKRRSWTSELRTELISFKMEAQVRLYEGFPESEHQVEEIYLKRFTENARGRSSRHASVSYHMETLNGEIQSCTKGVEESPPADPLQVRAVHFLRPSGHQFSGKMSGLLALLANAADLHHRKFSLFKRQIEVLRHPDELQVVAGAGGKVRSREWRLLEPKSGRSYHFFFLDREQRDFAATMTDLLRVEVRDARMISGANPDETDQSSDDPPNLLQRFEIVDVYTQLEPSKLRTLLEPDPICAPENPQPVPQPEPEAPGSSEDDGNDADEEEDEDEEDDEDDDWLDGELNDIFNDNETEDPNNPKNPEDTNNGDDDDGFEFEPERMLGDVAIPDFFEYLDGASAYSAESQLEVDGKTLLIRETVDLEQQWAAIIVGQRQADGEMLNHHDYYLNYNSELVFQVEPTSGECTLLAEPAPWLRLLSTSHTYLMAPGGASEPTLVEGSRLRLYGIGALWRLASESVYTDFVGLSKEAVLEKRGSRYRQVIWSLADDGDLDMQLHFRFLWNQTRWEEDKASVAGNGKTRQHHRHHRRAPEMLSLHSIYLAESPEAAQVDQSTDHFPNFKLSLINNFRRRVSLPLVLPGSCRELLDSLNLAAEANRRSFSLLTIPSFFDYLSSGSSYFAQYQVTHTQPKVKTFNAEDSSDPTKPPSSLSIVESYDRRLNRGKITIGQGQTDTPQVVFIDGAKRTIYYYAQHTCKKVANLRSLIPVLDDDKASDAAGVSLDNPDFSADQMFGLAQLWNQLAKMPKSLAVVRQVYDKRGNRQQVRDYSIIHPSKDLTTAIHMSFVSESLKPTPKSDLINDLSGANSTNKIKFSLRNVEIQPERLWKARHLGSLHKTTISVINLVTLSSPPDWILPDECRYLDNNTPGGTTPPADSAKLPSIASVLTSQEQLYMRAEVTVSRPMIDSDKRLYLLDEWLYRRNVRIKTYGLAHNLEALIYGATREKFDLSRAYKCLNQLPNIQPYSAGDSADVLAFWADNSSLVENLSRLYYAPAALWWMAEKNLANVKLSTALDIAPAPSQQDDQGAAKSGGLARDTRLESWRVESPSSLRTSWSYELFFEKKVAAFREWYVLQRIEIEETEWSGMTRRIQVEVIDYNWNQPRELFLERFLLPEGYNCTRSASVSSSMRQNNDDLGVNLDSDYYINYEASLELYNTSTDNAEQKKNGNAQLSTNSSKDVMPTITGTYIEGKDFSTFGPYVDFSAHYARVRFHNGTLRSSKRVEDRFRALAYQIDRLSGLCRIVSGAQMQSHHWYLDIPNTAAGGTSSWTVNLEPQVLRMLITRTDEQKYQPINRYSSYGQTISTWELSYPSLRVLPNLIGPVTVVRRYENKPMDKYRTSGSDPQKRTRLHKSLSIKVLVFSPDRQKLRATLYLSLLRVSNVTPTEVIRLTNVAQCYNDAFNGNTRTGRSFAIDYKLDSSTNVLWVDEKKTAYNFTLALLQTAKLQPTQFDGVPRASVDFNEQTIRIHFNLLEAPTAIEYFKFRPDATMITAMSKAAEVKPAATLRECSTWCDQLSCLAMSYCIDFTCRVLTAPMMGQIVDGVVSLDYSTNSPFCVYYYKGIIRPWTLDQFSSTMNLAVNEVMTSSATLLSRLALSFNNVQYTPSRFHQVDNAFGFIEEDLNDDIPEKAITTSDGFALKTFQLDSKLELANLEPHDQKVTTVHHASTLSECMNQCQEARCLLMSHCRQNGACLLVSEEAKNLKRLESSIVSVQPELVCSVSIRDYLVQYTRFEYTHPPIRYDVRLEQHTAVECAAVCHNSDTCLSFDVCFNYMKPSETNTTCYLQRSHVMMDDFDRSIMDPKDNSSTPILGFSNYKDFGIRLQCNHFSKTALADYRKIPNQQLDKPQSTGSLQGYSADRCAIECQQADDCVAFEHCFDDDRQPAQTCFIIRYEGNTQNSTKDLESKLTASKKCTIYVQKYSPELYTIDSNSHSFISLEVSKFIDRHLIIAEYFVNIAGYLIVAILAGSIIMITYTRVNGYIASRRRHSG